MRLLLKIAMVFVLTIAIFIPLLMINGIVTERQMYRQAAVAQVATSYAGAQRFDSPVLIVPYVETFDYVQRDNNGVQRIVRSDEKRHWVFFPDSVEAKGTLKPEVRKLGLHQVRVFKMDTDLRARFTARIPSDSEREAGSVVEIPRKIGEPILSYGVADARGLAGLQTLKVGGVERELLQSAGWGNRSGLHARLSVPAADSTVKIDTHMQFNLGGSERVSFVPLGKRNRLDIVSSWRHPQFNGAFLPPETPVIDANGFRAYWEVSAIASNAQAQYRAQIDGALPRANPAEGLSGAIKVDDEVGVSLMDPVNIYSMADRATKYGLLFVVLTFVGFFMFELIKQLRIHPIQYGLVGLALSIFFLLLVALSEHIEFGLAYLSASAACLGLLWVYVSSVLHSWLRGAGFAAMLGLLYAALYGLLISEDNAMVLGAGLLFLILAAIMIVTRKVDWYAVGNAMSNDRGATRAPPPLPQ